jgi:hypothetical protein
VFWSIFIHQAASARVLRDGPKRNGTARGKLLLRQARVDTQCAGFRQGFEAGEVSGGLSGPDRALAMVSASDIGGSSSMERGWRSA